MDHPTSDGATALAVVDFWQEAGPGLWFAKDPGFDAAFHERCIGSHERAAAGELSHWSRSPTGALAQVLLLDQFPRNAFRGTPRMYDTDDAARAVAAAAIAAGFETRVPTALRVFFVLPFAHSEQLADQDRAADLAARLGPEHAARAEHHREIVRRFGRFPHRNAILGRDSTPDEIAYLAGGGYLG